MNIIKDSKKLKWKNILSEFHSMKLIALFLISTLPTIAMAEHYSLIVGDSHTCKPFLNSAKEINYPKPIIKKNDLFMQAYRNKCSGNFEESFNSGGELDSENYAIYHIDIDNDGLVDDVLYHQWVKSKERRANPVHESYTEILEQFDKVDMTTCMSEHIFRDYAKNRILQLNGITYFENIDINDKSYKSKNIYLKNVDHLSVTEHAICFLQVSSKTKKQ